MPSASSSTRDFKSTPFTRSSRPTAQYPALPAPDSTPAGTRTITKTERSASSSSESLSQSETSSAANVAESQTNAGVHKAKRPRSRGRSPHGWCCSCGECDTEQDIFPSSASGSTSRLEGAMMLDQQEARVQEPDSVLTASNNEDETPKHKFVVPTIKITRPMNGHKYSTPVPDQRYEKGVLFVPVKTEELGWDENGLYWNGTYAYPINDIYDDEGGVIGRRRNGPDGYRFVELYDGQTKPVRYATTNLDPQLAPARSVLQDGCESVSGSSPSLPDTEEGEEREIGMEEVSLASPPITMDAKASSEQKCGRMARPNLTLDTGIINARYNDLPSEDSDALDTGSSEGDSYSVAPSVWSRRSSSSLVHSESTTPETSSPHSELDKDEQASQGLEADLLTEKLSLLRDGQDPLAPSSEHRLTFESIGKLETQEDPWSSSPYISSPQKRQQDTPQSQRHHDATDPQRGDHSSPSEKAERTETPSDPAMPLGTSEAAPDFSADLVYPGFGSRLNRSKISGGRGGGGRGSSSIAGLSDPFDRRSLLLTCASKTKIGSGRRNAFVGFDFGGQGWKSDHEYSAGWSFENNTRDEKYWEYS